MKNVQIAEHLFYDVAYIFYHVLNDEIRASLSENDLQVVERAETALNAKIDNIMKHAYYTASKDFSLSAEQREKARQDYLNLVGMHKDFRF